MTRILFGNERNDYLILRIGAGIAIGCGLFGIGALSAIGVIHLANNIDVFFNGENICDYDQCPLKYDFGESLAYVVWGLTMAIPAYFISGLLIRN